MKSMPIRYYSVSGLIYYFNTSPKTRLKNSDGLIKCNLNNKPKESYSNDRQSCISWWMKNRQHKVLPIFLGGGCNVIEWMLCKNAQLPRIVHITSQDFPLLTKKITLSTFSCGDLLAATCLDGSLYLIQKLSLKKTLQIEPRKDLIHPGQAAKEGHDGMITYVSISFSPSGCALLGLDNNSNLYISQGKLKGLTALIC